MVDVPEILLETLDRTLKALEKKIDQLEQQVKEQELGLLAQKEFIDSILTGTNTQIENTLMKIVNWHTHEMNGSVIWKYPKDILERKIKEAQELLKKRSQQANLKEHQTNPQDIFDFNLNVPNQETSNES